ncbi:MAG: DNA topoisomerase IB [Chloroflexota bacterium]|nr:DNA topoisomerase IB [Chloroflexota bacterium]MDQ6906898.1 DNA topoisomerase IB [Chloroflexota bacterium]
MIYAVARPQQKPYRRTKTPVPIADPVGSARAAGLRYVSDAKPGIARKRAGKGFSYRTPDGTLIRDAETLRRIRSLAIPPAWTDVWICPIANGHIQATGRDAKGRKQYRYHPLWHEVRDETKYTRMIAFGEALPRIRARVNADLARHGLPREKVLATVVRLLETTFIRVGNEEYAKTNNSYGLTTMRNEHVDVSGGTVEFHFRGKSGVEHTIGIKDPRVARIVKRCKELPGAELFQYLDDDGERQTIDSGDVNGYLYEITGEHFTAKDFRTWAGTLLAAMALQGFEAFDSETQAKKNIVGAIERVAERLGNTPTVCRKCYVHPAVLDGYLEGAMLEALKQRTEQEIADGLHGLKPEEAAVLAFLQQRLTQEMQAR